MKKWLLLVLMTLLAVLLVACGDDTTEPVENTDNEETGNNNSGGEEEKKKYAFKLGHEAAESHVKFAVAEKFAQELKKNSDGRMTVDIYPANQLGKEADMRQQIETGTLDFAILSNGTMSGASETMNGWFMPFLFNNLEEAGNAASSKSAKQMMQDLDKINMVGYGVFFAGQRHILANKAINSVDDLGGLKIRIPGAPAFEAYYKALSASPASMPLPEVYTALSTNVIDAVDTDLDAAVSQKFYEAVDTLTLTGHIVFPEVAIGSKKVIDGLSAEDKKIVEDTWASVIAWGVKESIAKNEALLKQLKDKGVTVNELSNLDEFKKLSKAVYDQYSSNATIKAFIEENQ